jgi:chorismate mutase
MEEKLKYLRKRIDTVDYKILGLLAERMNIADEIAAEKKKRKLPVLQKRREKEALTGRIDFGKKLYLKPIFTKKVFALLFHESKKLQQKGRRSLHTADFDKSG